MEPEKSNNNYLLKRSLEAIRILEEKLKQYENGRQEPVAVIGMACRFPGNQPILKNSFVYYGKEETVLRIFPNNDGIVTNFTVLIRMITGKCMSKKPAF